jgi:hypothetical protein
MREAIEQVAKGIPQFGGSTGGKFAEQGLELGEGLLVCDSSSGAFLDQGVCAQDGVCDREATAFEFLRYVFAAGAACLWQISINPLRLKPSP